MKGEANDKIRVLHRTCMHRHYNNMHNSSSDLFCRGLLIKHNQNRRYENIASYFLPRTNYSAYNEEIY